MTLIIFCHPDKSKKSHSHKILERTTDILKKEKRDFKLIDLYKEEFEACFLEKEYEAMKSRSDYCEQKVKEAQKKISESKTLIFIYPVWWYNMPARLKGFMDRVFTARFAYRFKKVNQVMLFGAWLVSWIPGLRYFFQTIAAKGKLKGKNAIIFRTYGGPALGKRIFGNTPSTLENVILRFCGITNIKIHELFNCDKRGYTQAYEDWYLKEVEKIVKKKAV